MSDRLAEIRARLDACHWRNEWVTLFDTETCVAGVTGSDYDDDEFIANAPSDIAYLLEEVSTLVVLWDAYRDEVKRLRDECERLQESLGERHA